MIIKPVECKLHIRFVNLRYPNSPHGENTHISQFASASSIHSGICHIDRNRGNKYNVNTQIKIQDTEKAIQKTLITKEVIP